MGPIKTDFIRFKKFELLNNRILIGIDFGCSLAKFIFLNKNNSDELYDESRDQITLQHAIFKNDDIENGLKWLKENAFIPQNTTMTIHGSGVGCFAYRDKIESIFGLKFVFVQEGLAIHAGHKIAFEQIGIENLKYPSIEVEDMGKIENEMITKMMESLKEKLKEDKVNESTSPHFPCLVIFCGSLLSYNYFDENGKSEQIGALEDGGKAFLGLAKCLLDTNSYDDVMELARQGNRCNVDTQVKDVLDETIASPYGKFPKELPLFPFGKCGDHDKGIESFSKEDLASSLTAFICVMIGSNSGGICLNRKIKKVYLTGNIFQSEVFRKCLQMKFSFMNIGIERSILDLGFCTALGAMFCTNEDKNEYEK